MADAQLNDAENGPSRMESTKKSAYLEKRRHKQTCKMIVCSQLFSVFCFAVGIAGGILIGIYAYHGGPDKDSNESPPQINNMHYQTDRPPATAGPTSKSSPPHEDPKQCNYRNPVIHSNYEESVYAPLTTNEMERIASFLMESGIVSTITPPKSLKDSFILYQSLLPPVKTDALKYLDDGGEKPGRYAKVTVQRGGISQPDVMEYKVGPLGVSGPLTCSEITQPGDIKFNTRPYEFLEYYAMEEIIRKDLDVLAPLIKESFDAVYPDDLYLNTLNGPPNPEGDQRETR